MLFRSRQLNIAFRCVKKDVDYYFHELAKIDHAKGDLWQLLATFTSPKCHKLAKALYVSLDNPIVNGTSTVLTLNLGHDWLGQNVDDHLDEIMNCVREIIEQ